MPDVVPGPVRAAGPDLAAIRAAVVEGWRLDATARAGGGWADLGGLAAHATGLPAAQWNGAHLLRDDADLGALHPFFAEFGVPWGLLVPAELGLRPDGFAPVRDQPLMARALPAPPPVWPDGLRVTTGAPAADVAAVQAAAFGDPQDLALAFVTPQVGATWSRFVTAYDGGVPVGTAQAVLAGRSAGVYGVAVRESHRGRGLGAALTAAALQAAAAEGFGSAHLNPSDLGRSVYARLGFVDLTPWSIWAPDYLA